MKRRIQLSLKRYLDLVIAGSLCVILAPVMALIALAISLDSPGAVFFRLRVSGRNGLPFDQWKYRTMVKNAREIGHRFETYADDPRITRVGRFLRHWSLDELPQLWNVLRGDMSLVGPRPTFAEVADKYSRFENQRLEVRPGMTGLAQVHGRNLISWKRRVDLDVEYVQHFSIWLDLRILLLTIPVLLRGQGIYGKDGRVRMHDLA